ncbi:MAG: hypothetical protein ACI9DK_003307, partial [Vicingaceae bacterium]
MHGGKDKTIAKLRKQKSVEISTKKNEIDSVHYIFSTTN